MTDNILQKTAASRRAFFADKGALLTELVAEGQSPLALLITCSDSRLMPEAMLGAVPGDYFVLRNIANVVPPYSQTDIGIAAVLEYAVLYLEIPRIIVCGHTDCGGVLSLDRDVDLATTPGLARWRDLIHPAQREVDYTSGQLSPEARHRAIVEHNVLQQLENVRSYPFVRAALADNRLTLHGWVYDLHQQQISYHDADSDAFVIA